MNLASKFIAFLNFPPKFSEFKMAELLNEGILLGMGNPLLGRCYWEQQRTCELLSAKEISLVVYNMFKTFIIKTSKMAQYCLP